MNANEANQAVVINGKRVMLNEKAADMILPRFTLKSTLYVGNENLGHRCAQKITGIRVLKTGAEPIVEVELDGKPGGMNKLAHGAKIFLDDYASFVKVYFDCFAQKVELAEFQPGPNSEERRKQVKVYELKEGLYIEHMFDGRVRVNEDVFKGPVNGPGQVIIREPGQFYGARGPGKFAGPATMRQGEALELWCRMLGLKIEEVGQAPALTATAGPQTGRQIDMSHGANGGCIHCRQSAF